MSAVEEAVANGIRWMNENLGEDWPDFIDRETFSVRGLHDCVLGQTFEGGWGAAVGVLDAVKYGPNTWAIGHGFDVMGTYDDLQAAWDAYLDEYELATA